MSQNGSFPDLVERTRSAVILVVLAAGAFWIGGHAVILLLAVTSALMSWEIASMYGENRIGQITIAVIAAASFVSVFFFDGTIRLIFLVPLAATLWLGRFRSPLLCMIAIVAIIEISFRGCRDRYRRIFCRTFHRRSQDFSAHQSQENMVGHRWRLGAGDGRQRHLSGVRAWHAGAAVADPDRFDSLASR
jgi:hypothetical protein